MTQQPHDHSQDTRRRLMEAALLAFAEKGFEGASVREIARSAKANPAMIAYHFGGKDGLYEAAMRWVCTDFHSRVQEIIGAAGPEMDRGTALESIRTIVERMFKSVAACDRRGDGRWTLHDAAHRLWDQEMANPRTSLLEFVIEQIRMPMGRIVAHIAVLRPGLSALELDTMLMGIHGAMLLFHKHFSFIEKIRGVPYSDDDLERMAKYFVDFSVRGLGVPCEAATEPKEP